ncbi:peroxidasin-like isoform X2 [Babylonia areolata]|uniref:peroxidasin-like isoform X2 n=1 Tax=Babylonia areolata TaxID=304850 RepID=UPI003FD38CEA
MGMISLEWGVSWRGVVVVVCLVASLMGQSVGCPARCLCFRTNVRCMFLQLDSIPASVPLDTTVLDLRFNKIRTIPRGAFTGLSSLNTLLLNNNEIERIEEGAFDGLPELRYLYLYKNNLVSLESKTFEGLSKLEQLFLHSNQISRLPKGVFSYTPHLRRLRLDSNALVCDCDMMWLADMLKEKHGYTQAAATCQYPQNLQGRSLMSISKDDFHCEKPTITMEPRDVDVTFGNTVYFTCRAEGKPVPDIVWMHNNNRVEISEESRFSLLHDGTLMIEDAQDDDKGVYECIARNVAGETHSNQVELRYFGERVAPRFTQRPQDVVAVEGQTVQLACRASGHPRPTFSWTKDLEQIGLDPRLTDHEDGTLTIRNVQESDRGDYQCYASNAVQTISATARLSVRSRPVITVPPADTSVVDGSPANFTCGASGDPAPTITWMRGNSEIRAGRDFDILSEGHVLLVRQARLALQGLYTCRADSPSGSITASARLIVARNASPAFSERSDRVSAIVGTDITLRCVATGEPEPLYEWMRDGRVVHSRNRMTVRAGLLTISSVSLQDTGRYDCVAENVVGRATKSIFLQVQGSSISRPGDRFVSNAIVEARNRVNSAVNSTLAQLFDRSRHHTVSDLIAAFRYPSPEALEPARAEEIFEQTLEIIHQKVRDGHNFNLDGHENSYQELVSPAHLHMIANMSGCLHHTHRTDCTESCFHRHYRTVDGTCNNLHNPAWGASNIPFQRLLHPIYENGFNTPVGWNRGRLYNGLHLPSPRLVSSLLMATPHITNDDIHTHMLMQWGQFLDHDLDLSPQAISFSRFSDGTRCNETCVNTNPCYPIPVPNSDQRIQSFTCLGFTRSSSTCNTGSTSLFYNTVAPRQQLNAITSFIDASNVYGSTLDEANHLRELTRNRGLLRTGPVGNDGKRFLPFDDSTLAHVDCQIEPQKRHVPCFRAGDHRANEQLALTAMHTLWMRQHNQIASALLQLNNHWDGNKVYHETRKIVGAMMQHITYQHWLPQILGPKGMSMMGAYKGYDPSVNPTIVNEFATAAFRFGHSLVQPVIFRLNESFQPIFQGNLPLHRAFFAPYRLLEEGGIDPLLRGLFGAAAKKRMPGEFFNSELTEKLFVMANAIGQDLASLNIQRGRDHGIQFYNDYREMCGLERARSFLDLRNEIQHRGTRDKLEALYGHPDNIDLFIGGMSETPMEGAKVGPTFLCIISGQFQRTRDGDRFYYENPGAFSAEQLIEIKRVSLAQVICQSSDNIGKVQEDVFLRVDDDDDYIDCSNIPRLDLRMWSDCCEDCRRRGSFNSFTSHFRGRRSVDQSYPEDRPIDPRLEDRRDWPGLDVTEEMYNDGQETASRNVTYNPAHDRGAEKQQERGGEVEKEEEEEKCMKEDVDIMDVRIEGMEAAMMEMNHHLELMQKKVRFLQKKLKGRGRQRHCQDVSGRLRRHGHRWSQDVCTSCICKKGQVECTATPCPASSCPDPVLIPGQCCPKC